jgi:hypothetical protein
VGIETVRNHDFFLLTAMRPEFVGVVNADGDGSCLVDSVICRLCEGLLYGRIGHTIAYEPYKLVLYIFNGNDWLQRRSSSQTWPTLLPFACTWADSISPIIDINMKSKRQKCSQLLAGR